MLPRPVAEHHSITWMLHKYYAPVAMKRPSAEHVTVYGMTTLMVSEAIVRTAGDS